MTIIYTLVSALFIMLASLAGALFLRNRIGSWVERNLRYLATFALGIFIVIVYSLSIEAIEHAGIWYTLSAGIGGIIIVALAARLIPGAHHHHERTDHNHSRLDARRMMAGDAIHNITDGFLLVPAWIAGPTTGIIATIAILAHELVQEIAEFFVLKEAGYSTKQALRNNFIVSSTLLLGVFATLVLSSVEGAEALLIAFSAGGFLFIILRDLIPNSLKSIRTHGKTKIHVTALITGIILMTGVSILAPHSHEEHSEGEHSDTEIIDHADPDHE